MVKYRTESYSGSGVRDAARVMAFETFELGNDDIITCLITQGYIKDPVLKDSLLRVVRYCSGEIGDAEMDETLIKAVNSEDDNDIRFFEAVLKEINKTTGKEIKYALWLADWDKVTGRNQHNGDYGYDMAESPDTDAYKTSNVILSDLGEDGVLYGYEEYPHPIASNLLCEWKN